MRIRLGVMYIQGMDGLQVLGIGSCRLVYNEVVEVKSYFWGFGNTTCGDSAGIKQTEKSKVVYLLDLFVGMGKKGHCDLVYGALVDDWVNAGLCSCLIHVIAVLIFSGAGPILRNACGI